MVPRPVSPNPPGPLIPRFYSGRDILITGGTGFMGKVLIERILSTCPDVGTLFLLMRDKKGHTPQKRLGQLKLSQVFDNIRDRCPRQLEKLCSLAGDVGKPRLGIDNDSLGQLRKVSVVFNAAATLKFDEPMGIAVDQNVKSVERMLELCDTLPSLEALVHVSTAYCNADLPHIEEKVYPAPIPPALLCGLTQSLPDDVIANITAGLISPKPNTYTFTKAVAENIVLAHGNQQYPIAIFRPTIVISSQRDPYPGWIENLNGPSGVMVGAGKGLLHVFCCLEKGYADMLPVDMAIDTMMAVAWEMAVDRPQQVRVYNCSTHENPTTWGEFENAMRKTLRTHPFNGSLWYPCGYRVGNKYSHKALELFLQTIPLHMAQYISNILRIDTGLNLITVSQRLSSMGDVLRYFSTRQWSFSTDNVQKLRARLTPQDAAIYNLDPHSIDWNKQFENFTIGIRKYLLQEKDQDLEEAKRHQRRLYYVHYGLIFFVVTLLTRLSLRNTLIRDTVYGSIRLLFSILSALYLRVRYNDVTSKKA